MPSPAVALRAVAVALCAPLVLANGAGATFPGKNGLIAYNAAFPAGAQIKVLNPRTGRTANVPGLCKTYVQCGDSDPGWAPSGRELLLSRRPLTSFYYTTATVLSGGRRRPLGDWRAGAWSPNGKRIAVVRPDGIYTVDPRGRDPRLVLAAENPNPLVEDWSSRNRILANDFRAGSFTVRPDGTGRIKLKGPIVYPSFSPDGRRIVYDRREGGHNQMRIMRWDGKFDHPIRPQPKGINPTWSPDGKLIAYTAPARIYSSLQRIFTIRPDGSHRKLIYQLPHSSDRPTAEIINLSWQPRPRR